MQQIGGDLAAILGGNYVNRFDLDGRSYKVIAQIERAARLTPEQLTQIHVSGPERPARPARRDRDREDRRRAAQLNRFQQLNAVEDLGRRARAISTARLRVLEDAAAKILPAGYRVDYTGESRQLRAEGGKFLPAMGLAVLLIFLVLAAQFNSFRDPFVILPARCRSRCSAR